ncbi:MAG: TA system VapC family ribonuclease toxin [Kineosporiaceae bacterium]
MSLLVDANLLVYAASPRSPHHPATARWLTARLEDPDVRVGFCWSVLYTFTRLASSRRVMGDAVVPVSEAWAVAQRFLQGSARIVDAGPRHSAIASQLSTVAGLTSNDVPDMQLAALAVEHGLTLCSHDRGFARFPGLSWQDPLDPGRDD